MKSFEFALEHVLKAEAGYVDNPADKGGPTNYGITLATLAGHRGEPCTADDVKALQRDEAAAIYLMRYWRPMGLDYLNSAVVAAIVFDQGVNRGPRVAVRALQAVLAARFAPGLGVDGALGEESLKAANSAPERLLALSICIEAQRGYLDIWRADSSQAVFLRGWIARTWNLLELCA